MKKSILTIGMLLFAATSSWAGVSAEPQFSCEFDQYQMKVWEAHEGLSAVTIYDQTSDVTTGYVTAVNHGLSGPAYWIYTGNTEHDDIHIALVENPDVPGQALGHVSAKTQDGAQARTIVLVCEQN